MGYPEWGDPSLPFLSYSILAIDFGEMTGIAWYDVTYGVLRCTSTGVPTDIGPMIALLRPSKILVERMPKGRRLSFEVEMEYMKAQTFYKVIAPGEWKPFMKVRKRKFELARTVHEEDAINLIRYYLITELGKDMP